MGGRLVPQGPGGDDQVPGRDLRLQRAAAPQADEGGLRDALRGLDHGDGGIIRTDAGGHNGEGDALVAASNGEKLPIVAAHGHLIEAAGDLPGPAGIAAGEDIRSQIPRAAVEMIKAALGIPGEVDFWIHLETQT